MNNTDTIPDSELAHFSWWLKVPLVIYLMIIHLFGVSSNIVVAIIYGRASSKSACDWLILTMSITDAFVCFCSPALYIRSCLRIPLPWKTSILCTLEYWLQLTAMFASCLLLAIIALDRYAKICRPGLLSLTPTMARNLCVITVLACAVVSLVPFFGRMTDSHCYINEIRETAVTKTFFTSMFVCFVMSFSIVTFAYASVCQKISQKIKIKQKLIENNGLNLTEQDNNQKANTHLSHYPSLWSQIFSSLPAKWKIRRCNHNKNERLVQSSNECLYSNGNAKSSGEDKYNNCKEDDADDNDETVFLSTNLKTNISEAAIMSCEQMENLSEKNSCQWQIRRAETALAMKTQNPHCRKEHYYSCPDIVSDSDQITRLQSKALQVLHNIGERHNGVFLPRYHVEEVMGADTMHNKYAISLLPLKIGNDGVDNVDSSSELVGTELKEFGARLVAPTYSKPPDLNTNYVDSCGRNVKTKWSSMPLVSVSKYNRVHAKRKVARNLADEPRRKQKYLTMFSNNVNTRDNCVLNHNKGNNFKSRERSSFCLLPQLAHFNKNTLDKISANRCPNIHVTNCGERDDGFRFLTSDSSLRGHEKRNSMVENDSIKMGLPDNFSLPGSTQLYVKLRQVVSRVPSSYTTRCIGCFQNPLEFSVNMDVCSFCRLATHNNRQRLIKSESCLSVRPGDRHRIICGRDVISKTEISSPTSGTQCAFGTTRSPNEESKTLQLPRKSQFSNVVLSDKNKHRPTDFPQKNISGGNQTASGQFQLPSSVISLENAPGQTHGIQQELDYSETTVIPNLLLLCSQTVLNTTHEIHQEQDRLETTATASVPLHYSLTQNVLKSTDEIQQEQENLETTDTPTVLLHHPLTQNVLKSTDEIQQDQDHLETTDTRSVAQHLAQSSLKPTGSTSSRRSNKSSSFADPVKITLMVDNNDVDDKSDAFSYMSTSPSTFAFRKTGLKEGCRTSGRSRSSLRSTTSSKLRFARERQITYMLLSVTAAFLLSWIPPWVMYMICLYGPMEYFKSAIIQYLATIHLLNYVASPIIYFTFNPTFRSKVRQLFTHSQRCRCCCEKELSQLESPDFNSSPI